MIIHIGLFKTGTTFLQKEIFPKMEKKVYSNEFLSGYTIIEREFIIRGIYQLYGKNCKIIIGIRNPETYKKSMYNQMVKGKKIFYGYKYWEKNIFDKRLVEYQKYIKLIKELFTDVHIYYFEDLKYRKKETIQKICEFCGCKIPNYKDKYYNKKLNKYEIIIFRSIIFIIELYKYITNKGSKDYQYRDKEIDGMTLC